MKAGEAVKKQIRGGLCFVDLLIAVYSITLLLPGTMGSTLRAAQGRWAPRPRKEAGHSIFPMPAFQLTLKQRQPLKGKARRMFEQHLLVNLWLSVLNWMHLGSNALVSRLAPSAAQKRAHSNLLGKARVCLSRHADCVVHELRIQSTLRQPVNPYEERMDIKRLGLRAGIPDKAATVDVYDVLKQNDPVLAEQSENPESLLLPPEHWPPRPRRPFEYLDSSYTDLIERAEVGAQAAHARDGPPAVGRQGHHWRRVCCDQGRRRGPLDRPA